MVIQIFSIASLFAYLRKKITVENINFHGDATDPEGRTMVNINENANPTLLFDGVSEVTVRNCTFKDLSFAARKTTPTHFNDRRGMLTAIDCDLIKIDGCTFSRIWREETSWVISRTAEPFTTIITDCLMEDYRVGCYSCFGIVGGDIRVEGSTFRNCSNTNSPLNIFWQ